MTLTDFRNALADMRWRIYNDGQSLTEPSEGGKDETELLKAEISKLNLQISRLKEEVRMARHKL